MSTPAPINPNAKPDASADPVVTPSFEYELHKFWEKNARSVYAFCAIVLLAIIGKGGYEFYTNWRDKALGAEYAAASTPEKLKAFAAAHPGQTLAGVAMLRLADEAFTNGNYPQAALEYQNAAEVFKKGVFAGRARLGAAIAKLQSGQAAEGEAQLKQLASDVGELKAVRAEASYQLASAAATAGRTDEALKFLDQVSAVEPAGTWAQRALMLRATLPAPAASAALPNVAIPSINLPAKP